MIIDYLHLMSAFRPVKEITVLIYITYICTFYIIMDYPIHIVTMSMELSILNLGSPVHMSRNDVFLL